MEIPLKHSTCKVTYSVFVFALIIVGINLISVIFPSLILEVFLGNEIRHNPFELGSWAIPIITANLAALGLGIFYFKNKLPSKISGAIRFAYHFEVSKEIALIVVLAILFFYVGGTIPEAATNELFEWADYKFVRDVVEIFPEMAEGSTSAFSILVVKNSLLKVSDVIFDNMRIMPILASAATLLLTYFFTYEITKKRFAGIIALVMLLQSFLFLRYDSSATYANFWTLFYLLSLYLIVKKRWYLSPISFLASIFSKPLTAVYLPMTLFLAYRANIPQKMKLQTIIVYAVIVVIGIYVMFGIGIDFGAGIARGISYDHNDFLSAFTIWSYQLRFEGTFLLFILPVTVGLFLTARKVNPIADAILFLIVGVIIAMPLLAGLSWFNLHPYRFVPLMVFFAIGVGTLFSNKIKAA